MTTMTTPDRVHELRASIDRVHELRASILAAHESGDIEQLHELQARYRALPLEERREVVLQVDRAASLPSVRLVDVHRSPQRGTATPAALRLSSAPPTSTIRLDGACWARVREECRDAADGRETAGWLFASRHGSPLDLQSATGPGFRPVREVGRCVIDGDWSDGYERELAANESDLIRVGIWHVHPNGVTTPSATDLRSWQAGYEILEERAGSRAAWSALIVTPGPYPVGGDIDPQFHGFVVRRDPISRRIECERASVTED